MTHDHIEITLPMPTSVNHAYKTVRNRKGNIIRAVSDEHEMWVLEATLALRKFEKKEIEGDEWLEVSYEFRFPLYNKNGTKKKKDTFNFEKVLSDFLAVKIKWFADHKIISGQVCKVDSPDNVVIVKIWEKT